jgi:membrane fusion protein, copper/silver efflux system
MRSFSKFIFLFILTSALAGGGVWYAVHHQRADLATSDTGGRKVLYYQSAMHPWVKSDKPGRCTICGMELTPVYEGSAALETAGDVVPLTASQIQVLNVQVTAAKVQPLTRRLQVAGMIDDDDTRHRVLSAYVDGRIEKLHVNYVGAEVAEGDPLVEIYSPTLLAMEREYVTLQRSGVSKDSVLLDGARLKLLRTGLSAAQIAALPQKPADASTSQILAPMSGTVVAKDVYEGQYVAMGAKLLDIADFSLMWFQFRAYEQDMPWIRTGQTVEVTTPSVPGRVFSGTVKFLDPNFDEATRSTKVRVELPNVMENGRCLLLHRLYADGVVQVSAPEVLAVPRSAVIQTGPEAIVYVEQSGAYARTPVKTGRRGVSLIEIL